jgi:3',5'-cyclic AMP phosphodiesterase CpdA
MLTGCAKEDKKDTNNAVTNTEGGEAEITDSEELAEDQIQAVNGTSESNAQNPVQFVVATDIHYFAKELTDNGPLFQRMLVSSDGKQVNYITEITDAFLEEVIEMHPAGLILSGDLTFNGEKKSHEELGEKLKAVSDAGIPVYVIPGNHDLNNYYASRYSKDNLVEVDNITPEDFKQIYGSFGLNNAIYKDEKTLSYVSEVTKDVWLFMLDTNRYEFNSKSYPSEPSGIIGRFTFAWLEKCLKEAAAKGVTPIVVMHHNLLKHNEKLFYGFTLDGYQDIVDLFHKYNVNINLSGHIHMQSIVSDETPNNTVYDIVTSALSVYTNQYGVLDVIPGVQADYYTKPVDMQNYAKEKGLADENLLNFEEYSYKFFTTNSHKKILAGLKDIDIPEEEKEIMAELSDKINANYFAGTINEIQDELKGSEGYKLWIKYGDDILNGYITGRLNKPAKDETHVSIPLNIK